MTAEARGSAVVTSITRTPDGTRLLLRGHTGGATQLVLPVLPDTAAGRRAATAFRRAVAVIIRYGGDPPCCVLLGTSRRGPVRCNTTLGAALALCESGVYTVILYEPPG